MNSDTILDPMRLSKAQLQEISDLLDARGNRHSGSTKRGDRRFNYGANTVMTVEFAIPGGSTASYRVIARDLSGTGAGFLHGVFAHTGTGCDVELITTDRKRVRVRGRVARCELVKGRVHFVGVRFDQPIDLSQFIPSEQDDQSPETATTPSSDADPALAMQSILGELLAQCAAKECPPQIRKLTAQLKDCMSKFLATVNTD